MEQDDKVKGVDMEDVVMSTDAIVDQLADLNKTMDEIGKVLAEISGRLMALQRD